MYKCEECSHIFDEPLEISAGSFYGVSEECRGYNCEEIKCCPICEGNYVTHEEEEEEDVE